MERRNWLTKEEVKYQDDRDKCRDGFRMALWPEFLKLMDRMKVKVPRYQKSAEVHYAFSNHHDHVFVTFDDVKTDTGLQSIDVFWWPESQAWFRRLGIPLEVYIKATKIRFARGEQPLITSTYVPAQLKEMVDRHATNVRFSDDNQFISGWEEPAPVIPIKHDDPRYVGFNEYDNDQGGDGE